MDPHVYPDPQSAPLHLTPGGSPVFAAIEQLAAADPATPAIPKTMFIRVAMSGADCPALSNPCAPAILLKVDNGDPVPLSGLTQPIFRTSGMQLADYAADVVEAAEAGNIYLVTVTFLDAAGSYTWQLGLRNNDAAAARDFVWVVSATQAGTSQPWIDVSPTSLLYRLLGTGPVTQSVQIANKGSAPFVVSAITPPLPAGFVLGALPAGAVNPRGSTSFTITFNPPGTAGLNTVISTDVEIAISPADTTAGDSAGHNRRLALMAIAPQLQIGVSSTVGVDTLLGTEGS